MIRAVDADLSLVALAMAAAVPAICASLLMEDGRSRGDDYTEWCRQNLYPGKGFDKITPEELYLMRNGLLHQGRVEISHHKKGKLTPGDRFKGVVFDVDGKNTFTDCFGDDRYIYTVRNFCENMAAATRDWIAKEQANSTVATNLERMMRYRPFQAPGWNIEPAPRAIY
jgi:hypothetical protein